MKKPLLIAFALILFSIHLNAQKNVRTYMFGHSLLHHEWQINETPSQETSVPHWFHFLAEEAGHDYATSGQYGFLPNHAMLPPEAGWYFDFVPAAWDSENEPFTDANFTNILLTPGNFIQWQSCTIDYQDVDISPIEATNQIFDWCVDQDPNLDIYIYENWPDMGGYLANGFPPTQAEWETYNNYLNGDFHAWFLDYYSQAKDNLPNTCIKMIPAGPIISSLLFESPYDDILITELYEDDAPHGRPNTYFLAAMITYMAMYEEITPTDYTCDLTYIDPIIANNYQAIADYIWAELLAFNDGAGNSMVFCSAPTATSTITTTVEKIEISPNPFNGQINIKNLENASEIRLYDAFGKTYKSVENYQNSTLSLDVQSLSNGLYYVVVLDKNKEVIYKEKIVKTEAR